MDVELVCSRILALLERRLTSLRAILEERRWPAPRALLHALCLGVLRNYRFLQRALRYCGYRGQVRGGRPEGWLPIVVAYEAVFRRGFVEPSRLERFLEKRVVDCLLRVEKRDVLSGLSGVERLSVEFSVPRWVVEKLVGLEGLERARSILEAFQEPTPMYIRVNTSLVSRDEALEMLRRLGVEARPDPVLPDVVVVERVSEGAVERLDPRLFYIQDRSAALVSHVLGAHDAIADLFSAPGGKAGHAAWLHVPRVLAALDVSRRRLRSEARLLGKQGVLHIVDLAEADARRPPLRRAFDAVIVDPDCSSIGRIGHSPETRLFLEQTGPRIVERLSKLQLEGLKAAFELVKPGGVVVYSTCTLTREENEDVVAGVVEESRAELLEAKPWVGEPSRILPQTQRVYPDRARCGGGFVAKLLAR